MEMFFNRFKKFFFASVIGAGLAASSLSYANCGCSCNCGFTGVYLGASVGYVSSVSKYNYNSPFLRDNDSADIGIEGVDGGLQLGFGGTVARSRDLSLYLGIETSALLIGAKGHSDTRRGNPGILNGVREITERGKLTNYFDVSVRIGVPIKNIVMPYIRFGRCTSRWHIQHLVSDDLQAIGFFNRERNKQLVGFTMAVGMETLICHHTLLGLELSHTNYKLQKFHIAPNIVDPLARTTFKPRYTRGAVRLSYLF
jgi:opacity protein-like surface antigen